MRRLVMITSAVLALGSGVGAQPSYDRDQRTDESNRTRYDEGYRHRYDSAWSLLGSGELNMPIQKLMVGAQAGRFGHLRIQATSGRPVIRHVYVRFVDNTLQVIDVDRRLRPGEFVDLDVAGGARRISSVTIQGRPDPRAAYTVSAQY
jgi:hypothetical protein